MSEYAHSINGVDGRMFARHVRDAAAGTFSTQTWKASRTVGAERTVVELRFDDQCGNGHNTFSATCTIYENGRDVGGGAAHDHIAAVFPELAPLLKWHLVSSDGPMHYVGNAVYLAGTGEGKARELDAARSVAVWPDATDAELTADDLTQRLAARLPALMLEFRAAIEAAGFAYTSKE